MWRQKYAARLATSLQSQLTSQRFHFPCPAFGGDKSRNDALPLTLLFNSKVRLFEWSSEA